MRGMNAVVQKLAGGESTQVTLHLQQLSQEDRALRFAAAANDAAIERYVASIDFAGDAVFGLFEPDQPLVGVAHLARCRDSAAAELGLSVAAHRRGQGYGYALLSIAAAHAARLGFRQLSMNCLVKNRVMIHLARKAGMIVVYRHAEADAHIALQPFPGVPKTKAHRRSLLEWLAIMRGAWPSARPS